MKNLIRILITKLSFRNNSFITCSNSCPLGRTARVIKELILNFKFIIKIGILYGVVLCISCTGEKEVIETIKVEAPVEKEVVKSVVEVEKKAIVKGDAFYSSLSGEVFHKRSKEVVWELSPEDTQLFLKDWVKTGEGSSSTISMNKGRLIKMSENSRLILLDKSDKEKTRSAVIGVSNGDVEGQIEGTDGVESEIVFKLPHAWLRVKSSLQKGVKKIFRISLTNDKMKIHVDKGDVEVLTKGKVVKLTENKVYQKKIKPSVAKKEIDFMAQTEPPAEIKEVVVKKKSIIFKKIVKKFEITYPGSSNTFELESVVVKGVIPNGQEVIYKGKPLKVVNNMFSVKVDLKMGTNIVTFQVINGDKVSYKTLELVRK